MRNGHALVLVLLMKRCLCNLQLVDSGPTSLNVSTLARACHVQTRGWRRCCQRLGTRGQAWGRLHREDPFSSQPALETSSWRECVTDARLLSHLGGALLPLFFLPNSCHSCLCSVVWPWHVHGSGKMLHDEETQTL